MNEWMPSIKWLTAISQHIMCHNMPTSGTVPNLTMDPLFVSKRPPRRAMPFYPRCHTDQGMFLSHVQHPKSVKYIGSYKNHTNNSPFFFFSFCLSPFFFAQGYYKINIYDHKCSILHTHVKKETHSTCKIFPSILSSTLHVTMLFAEYISLYYPLLC